MEGFGTMNYKKEDIRLPRNAQYNGEWKGGLPNGKGIMVYSYFLSFKHFIRFMKMEQPMKVIEKMENEKEMVNQK